MASQERELDEIKSACWVSCRCSSAILANAAKKGGGAHTHTNHDDRCDGVIGVLAPLFFKWRPLQPW